MRWPWQCHGGHGGVRWGLSSAREGTGGTGEGASGSAASWRVRKWSAPSRARAGRAANLRSSRCTEGVRHNVGLQSTGNCGQLRGPKFVRLGWLRWGALGDCRGHACSLVFCWVKMMDLRGTCPWSRCYRAWERAWGCLAVFRVFVGCRVS